jgi:hypothetical protein
VHAANSACLFTRLDPLYDCVRPGISAYGVLPGDCRAGRARAGDVAAHARSVFLKDIPPAREVGYSATWRAERADAHRDLAGRLQRRRSRWRLSNRGEVLVRGVRADRRPRLDGLHPASTSVTSRASASAIA